MTGRMIFLFGLLVILIHYSIFCNFLPNNQGMLGHDYSFFFPALLDGFFYYHTNGLFSVPWFTPSFCGGVPLFPHPTNPYYYFPQLFTFFFNPLTSIKITLLLFGALGFWGFYILTYRILCCGKAVSLLGATIFLFNGFYSHRIIIGHLEFHSIMLAPWFVYFIFISMPHFKSNPLHVMIHTTFAGIILSYLFYSGMGQLLLPFLLSTILISFISIVYASEKFDLKSFFLRLFSAGFISIALSISKLVATFSFLSHFPRSGYLIPGFKNIQDLLFVLFRSLFLWPAHEKAKETMINLEWSLNRHEFEFGITIIPLLFILFGLVYYIQKRFFRRTGKPVNVKKVSLFFTCVIIGLIPIILNYYSEALHQIIKSIPILKSSGQFIRWFIIYIPSVSLLSILLCESTPFLKRNQVLLSLLSITIIIVINISIDRTYYHEQIYDPSEILHSYRKVKNREWVPRITHIAVCADKSGQILLNQNGTLTKGYSQLYCEDPIFGYRLEYFPKKSLKPGDILLENNGFLNLKNPACYIFPEENHCMPGDHFTVQQKDKAIAFANYKPFDFIMSTEQIIANYINLMVLFLVGLFIVIYSVAYFLTGIFHYFKMNKPY